jgi:hypothetical protein
VACPPSGTRRRCRTGARRGALAIHPVRRLAQHTGLEREPVGPAPIVRRSTPVSSESGVSGMFLVTGLAQRERKPNGRAQGRGPPGLSLSFDPAASLRTRGVPAARQACRPSTKVSPARCAVPLAWRHGRPPVRRDPGQRLLRSAGLLREIARLPALILPPRHRGHVGPCRTPVGVHHPAAGPCRPRHAHHHRG